MKQSKAESGNSLTSNHDRGAVSGDAPESSASNPARADMLAIAATFTAEPIAEAVDFWLEKLGLSFTLEFAPYNQVFQQLLDPSSLLAANRRGVNAVLVRIEDWQRHEHTTGEGGDPPPVSLDAGLVDDHLRDLVSGMRGFVSRTSVPILLVLCPCSPHLSAVDRTVVRRAEESVMEQLSGVDGLSVIGPDEIERLYPVQDYYDGKGDALGHMPFTDEFFVALATLVVRRVHALTQPPYKVIALDCDQTLWKGVCGEDGPMGIEIDPPRQMLQEFMVAQSKAGMLICLCSKNVEEDVWAVFDQRPDMPLKREHVVAWRINWQAKSENLRALAGELNLGLDSFIFVDDNPVECSEVGARSPEVLTLELPREVERIPSFLQNIWPFDRVKVTDADRQRTAMYRQNLDRERFQQAGNDFESFIEGLQLQIDVSPMAAGDLARVAQLTQRTNQFNATTIRRTEAEIQQWCAQPGHGCLTVHVKDRFGDYGLVGVILHGLQQQTLLVDTFLLSCRVLGRGVEHRMVAELGQLASAAGASRVTLAYRETAKNRPVADFLEAIGEDYRRSTNEQVEYQLPLAYAADLRFQPAEQPSSGTVVDDAREPAATSSEPQPATRAQANKSAHWNEIGQRLTTPASIAEEVNQRNYRHREKRSESDRWIAPRNDVEAILAQIWSDVLRVDPIGVNDNFFDLGGTSVLAVGIFTRIETKFDRRLPITTLLSAPTIELLAELVTQDVDEQGWNPLVPVRVQGSRRPLFVVHGGFGDVLGLTELARLMSEDQPFYALRAYGLDGEKGPLESVESMAEQYINAIKTVQPTGPYCVAGHCGGGVVAFEMAQQLTRQGERVAFLGLIETAHPQIENHFTSRSRYYGHRPGYRHPKRDWIHNVSMFAAYYWHQFGVWGGGYRRALRRRNWPDRLAYVAAGPLRALRRWASPSGGASSHASVETNSRSEALGANVQPVTAVSVLDESDAARRFFLAKERFFEVYLKAQARYHPKPYPGRLDFFLTLRNSWVPRYSPYDPRSVLRPSTTVDDPHSLRFGWDRLVPKGDFVLHPLDSAHLELFNPRELQLLGRTLDDRLQQLHGERTT